MCTPLVDHWGERDIEGIENIDQAETRYRWAFPDYEMRSEHVVNDDGTVAHHGVITGSHEGEFNGIPPTGSEITFAVMAFHRIVDGTIAET